MCCVHCCSEMKCTYIYCQSKSWDCFYYSLQFLVFNLVYDNGVEKNKQNVMSQSESLYRGSSLTTEILCTISQW